MTPAPLGVLATAAAVHTGSQRAADLMATTLQRCHDRGRELGAFVATWDELALAGAEAIDRARARGAALGPLAGVPFSIKDNLLLRGQIAACGSRMLETFVAPYTATAVARLLALGAVPIGRTNMDEFGMGSSTEHSAFFPTRNPWAPDRVPGGSSGGAAAAVAADLCPLALGSDTGGSVRQPAAFCGITGLKPTYGRLSRHGLVAYASSLDCVGILARSAADVAAALAIAGCDPCDPTSLDAAVPDFAASLPQRRDLAGLRIGVPAELFSAAVDAEVRSLVEAAIAQLGALGAKRTEAALPSLPHALPTYYLIAAAEASSNLARFDGVRFGRIAAGPRPRDLDACYARDRSSGFGDEVQLRILLGTYALQQGYRDEVYGQASRVRRLVQRDFARAFATADLLLFPTTPGPAFRLGERLGDPLQMYASDLLTVPASLASLPALSLPCGFTRQGLPVGLQLVAPALGEALLLQVAHCYQQTTDWHLRRPLP